MSYDLYLNDPVSGQPISFDNSHFIGGGTQALGGTDMAWLNITYNYCKHFYNALGDGGIRSIYGKTGAESIPLLKAAMNKLGDDVDDTDYWNPTEGNAKRALAGLLALAQMRPDGVWSGD